MLVELRSNVSSGDASNILVGPSDDPSEGLVKKKDSAKNLSWNVTLVLPTQDNMAEWRKGESRAGDVCPACHAGILDYNGLLELVCPECGYTQSGCST
jgi:hypothetical protein